MVSDLVAICCGVLVSATCAVNVNVPTTDGVPLSTPAELKVIPLGNGPEPDASDQT